MVSTLKAMGYLISTVSVLLLGAVSWNSASQSPLTLLGLIVGMAASMAGMLLRWLSHRREQAEKRRVPTQEREPAASSRAPTRPWGRAMDEAPR